MATKADWQDVTGQTWARMYDITDRAFSVLTQQLLEKAAQVSGSGILDIGCGAGELSLALARARPNARIIGLDVSDDLVASAQQRGIRRANASFTVGDAAEWASDEFTPDLLISRHGVMFFDDPVGAFRHLHNIAAPGAGLLFSCFRSPPENIWANGIVDLLDLPPAPDPHAPGPFAFAEQEYVRGILSAADWSDISFEAVDFPFIIGMGDDRKSQAMRFLQHIGPAARALKGVEPAERDVFLRRIEGWLTAYDTRDIVALPAAAWIVQARQAADDEFDGEHGS